MALEQWALPQLSELMPLDEESLKQIIVYTDALPDAKADEHLRGLLGDSPQALEFITSFNKHRSAAAVAKSKRASDSKDSERVNDSKDKELPAYAPPSHRRPHTNPVIEAGHIRARDEVR
ncbi:hypothetical protein V1519DRAFT_151868, partial [Lipomyces tetrasporus]